MRAYTRPLLAATACLVLVGAQDSNYVYPAPFVAWEQLSVANGTTISAPITGNGWVVAANSDGSLVGRQIDDFNGSSVWNYTASSSPYNVIFNLPNGQGFAAYYDTYVIAMTFDGNPLWQWNTTDNNATVGPYYELLMYTPVFDGDVVFIGTSSTSDLESPSYVYALNTSSGNVTWASFAGGDCNTQMDKDEKKLYVSSYQNGDMLQAFDLKTGELVWNVTIPHMAFTLKVANEKVFVGSYTGAVWVYDAATGKSKGSLPVQGDAVLVPMTVIAETLIVFSGGHANGINVNTQKVAFFANQISATENVKGYMVDGETIFVAYYGVVYKMNAKNGKGGKFYSSDFIFDDFGGFTYLRNKTILAFTMSALVFLDAKTGKLILAETNTNPVGTPLLLPPNAAGEEIIAVGNQLAAPGWPMECMKLFYVPMLTVQAADGTSFPGSYWGTVTVFTPMNPIYEAGTLYSFDTNYMYSFDPTTGVMNWEWTNPNLVMVTFPPMLYTSGILVATTGYTDIFVNASQGVQANYNSSNFGSYGGKYLAASNSGLVYIVGTYSSAILTVDVNTFTVVSQYNDSSLTCKTAPTPLNIVGGGNWVAAQCKGRLAMLDAAHGLTVWNITLPSTYEFTSHPFFSADETTLYIGFFTGPASGTLYAMNTSTGMILWKLDTIDPVYTGNVSCTVDAKTGVESCDTLIVASPNAMYSINAHTGAVQWKATHLVNMTGTMLLSPVHIVGETVVVRNSVLMWGVNLKTGEIMWVVTPDNADYSFGENGASTNGRYFFTPMAAYVLGYDVMNGNLVLKVYTQGTPNGVVITENCVMIFAQTPSDVGDNEVMGLTLPSSLCTPMGSM